ncbi:MAG: long-chain fatty acid--CoA ligase [Porticoccaceae bacterium]|nr:long-chain fatty acid--CoA ligase [Porticoccaceae bacterium]
MSAPEMIAQLSRLAQSQPEKLALYDGQQPMTYRQLMAAVTSTAAQLEEHNARRIALSAENGVDWLVADLACQYADKPLLPLPPFFSGEQIHHAISEVGIDSLIATSESPSPVNGGFDFVTTLAGTRLTLWQRRGYCTIEQPDVLPPGTGKITYTSGSTGKPKGVCLSNSQLAAQAVRLSDLIPMQDRRHLCLLPLSVLLENVAGVYSTLLSGGTVLAPDLSSLGETGSSSLRGNSFLAALDQFRPHSLILIPEMLRALVNACEKGWQPPSCLTFIAVGGSMVDDSLIQCARTHGLPVYQGYGLSECASVVSLNTPTANHPGSVGKPLPGLHVLIVQGEVVVAGNPFLGYVDQPDSWGHLMIRTGDLGWLDESHYLHLTGRKKNLIINSFGRNISPEWVEGKLMASPAVAECVVLGDGHPHLCALIWPGPGTNNGELQGWIDQCNGDLPDYARIHHWHVPDKPLSAHPDLLTATGKLRREAVANTFAAEIAALYELPLEITP